jgi:DNA-binding MarR family transcriptional regulator
LLSAKRKEQGVMTEAPIDLGPLGDSVGYLLRRAQVAVFQRFFELFAEFDIRPAQYSTLTVIERNPGLSQTRLADALGIKKTNLVAIIDALEERGLARRESTENDRRSHALYLTPKGTVLIGRLHQIDAALDQSISRLMKGDERQRLRDVLRQVAVQWVRP